MTDTGVYSPTEEERQEFQRRLAEAQVNEQRVVPKIKGKNAIWMPQDGSQANFMDCELLECLYHGTRGPGKTDALLMAFAQYVGEGFGAAWTGIIFRQSYPQLADVQAKSEKWFRQIFPRAKFNRAKMQWEWPTGEKLLFRHMSRPQDYWNYHGHEYPFIGWEELCNFADDRCYTAMFACCRTSTPGVPRLIRSTTNPYGPGHNWVKERFRLYGKWWETIAVMEPKDEVGRLLPARAAIHGHIDENKILLLADPHYKQTIVASASNPAMAEAWLSGSWDIVAGGMFGDVWSARHNLVPAFVVPMEWRLDRSFDWGSSSPFSVGWWAESDGCDVEMPGRGLVSTVRGDLYRIREWYGCTGKPNQGLNLLAGEIATGIVERELAWDLRGRVWPGPADNQIHNTENGMNIGTDMSAPIRIGSRVYPGVQWTRSDKSKGSRKTGWEAIRKMMRAAHPTPGKPREHPGLFVVEAHCPDFVRTVPALARSELDMDDIAKGSEDHVGDETRYRVRSFGQRAGGGRTVGMY